LSVLIDIWQCELDHINLFPLGVRGIVRQFLEEQPLIRCECPQRELRRTITRFNQAGVAHFCDVFVVLVPGDGVEREIGLIIHDIERTGVEMDLNFLRSQASLRIETPPTKANIP